MKLCISTSGSTGILKSVFDTLCARLTHSFDSSIHDAQRFKHTNSYEFVLDVDSGDSVFMFLSLDSASSILSISGRSGASIHSPILFGFKITSVNQVDKLIQNLKKSY